MKSQKNLAAVIMAAGKGTRMKDPARAKVMYEILDKPLLGHVIDLTVRLGIGKVVVIVGHQKDVVIGYVTHAYPSVECVVQEPQLGTGHAVMQARNALESFTGDVLVLSGDVPLLTEGSVNRLTEHHAREKASATILTAEMSDPAGYGRIIRNSDRTVKKVVEHRDATPEERDVREINSGIYVFQRQRLFDSLELLKADNVQHEYYLTDTIGHFVSRGWKVSALQVQHVDEIRGINTIDQLEEVRKVMESGLGGASGHNRQS